METSLRPAVDAPLARSLAITRPAAQASAGASAARHRHAPSDTGAGRFRPRLALALLAALLLSPAMLPAARAADPDAGPLLELSSFPRSALTIHSATSNQAHVFRVWIADTPERQSQGLMFVQDLPADEGMLFYDRQSHPWAMWMKNTFIPLDMLFIDARGRVVAIIERTVPHSLQTRSHPRPVKAVLELRGGEVERRGIRAGDRVDHPAFRGRASGAP